MHLFSFVSEAVSNLTSNSACVTELNVTEVFNVTVFSVINRVKSNLDAKNFWRILLNMCDFVF